MTDTELTFRMAVNSVGDVRLTRYIMGPDHRQLPICHEYVQFYSRDYDVPCEKSIETQCFLKIQYRSRN